MCSRFLLALSTVPLNGSWCLVCQFRSLQARFELLVNDIALVIIVIASLDNETAIGLTFHKDEKQIPLVGVEEELTVAGVSV